MANKNFAVKNGLEVGTAVTIDAATGNITTSGDVAVNGGDITTTQTTANLLNATATTVNAFSAATVIGIGAGSGVTTVNHDLAVNGGDITTNQTTFNLLNTTATTVNAFGAAGNSSIGYNSTANSTTNLIPGNTASGNTASLNILTGGQSGSTSSVFIGNSLAANNSAYVVSMNVYGSLLTNSAYDAVNAPSNAYFILNDTSTNSVLYPVTVQRRVTSGNGATGIGSGIRFRAENTSGALSVLGYQNFVTTDATAGSVDADFVIELASNVVTAEKFRVASTGDATIQGDLRINGNDIQCSSGASTLIMTSANTTTTLRGDTINLQTAAGSAQTSAGIGYTRTYGEFAYTAGTITIAAQNTVYAFPLDTTLNNSGVTISSTSHININVSGWYKIIMSLQAAMTTNSIGTFDFWLRKNGSDVPNSATIVDLLKDQKSVVAMDWLVESDGNDYWEIMYASPDADYADIDFPYAAAWTTPGDPYDRPAAPPILVNVIPAGM